MLSRGTLTSYLGLIVESMNNNTSASHWHCSWQKFDAWQFSLSHSLSLSLLLSLNNNYYAIANIFTPLISVFQQSTAHKRTGLRVNIAAPTHTEDPRRSIERVSDKLLIWGRCRLHIRLHITFDAITPLNSCPTFIIIEWKIIVRIYIMCANSWLMWSKKEQLIVLSTIELIKS